MGQPTRGWIIAPPVSKPSCVRGEGLFLYKESMCLGLPEAYGSPTAQCPLSISHRDANLNSRIRENDVQEHVGGFLARRDASPLDVLIVSPPRKLVRYAQPLPSPADVGGLVSSDFRISGRHRRNWEAPMALASGRMSPYSELYIATYSISPKLRGAFFLKTTTLRGSILRADGDDGAR